MREDGRWISLGCDVFVGIEECRNDGETSCLSPEPGFLYRSEIGLRKSATMCGIVYVV